MSTAPRVLVIGGGAAGFFAAVTCRRTSPEAQVTLAEATDRTLMKVRISGGGRCNVTHACFDPAKLVKNYPRGDKELLGPFYRFQPRDIVAWFEEQGVQLKTEEDGRMFPVTDSSETIARCLEDLLRRSGAELLLKHKVKKIDRSGSAFEVFFGNGTSRAFDKVLLATGGSRHGMDLAAALGHTIVSPVPSLFTFTIAHPLITGLSGISFSQCGLLLSAGAPGERQARWRDEGPVLITHWGLSGPAVLRLSAKCARMLFDSRYQAKLTVNWIAPESQETALEKLMSGAKVMAKKQLASFCPFPVGKRFWAKVLESASVDPQQNCGDVTKESLRAVAGILTGAELMVTAKGEFKEEFVTCGGVSCKEVDWATMESRKVPGVYFAGEVLDVDGFTGGFNFQAAWTTGWIGGSAIARL